MAITRSHSSKQRAGPPVVAKKTPSQTLLSSIHDRPGAAVSKKPQASLGAKKRARRPSAQLQAELENTVSSITSASELQKAPVFLFVPFPDVYDVAQEPHLAIDASNPSDRFLARYPMYNAQNMAMIQQELGKGFASYGMTSMEPYYEIPILHQGVVTMQHLSHSFDRDVTFRSWKWLQAQLETVTARPKAASSSSGNKVDRQPNGRKAASHPRKAQQHTVFTDPNTPCIIYLHWTTDPGPPTADLDAIYSTLRTLQSSRPAQLIRAFPSRTELEQETLKIPDIQALDHIASTSPAAYAYRPITCFTHASPDHDASTCPLRKHSKIVMKRTHSSSGQHVQIVTGCHALPHHHHSPSSSPSPQQTPTHWFAQSYEPSFTRFGEFRVFITSTPTSTSQPQGRIISTIITEWVNPTTDPTEMYARVATTHDFSSSPHNHTSLLSPLTLPDLHAFALHVYTRLRTMHSESSSGGGGGGFESLEVGVRLDIGVSGKKGRCFFVNEITRFYAADFFSQHTLGAPQQEVCMGFAEALDGYFFSGIGGKGKRKGKGKGDIKDEDED